MNSMTNQIPLKKVKTNASAPHGIIRSLKIRKARTAKLRIIRGLLDFLDEGFQEPWRILDYLQSRERCSKCKVRKGCKKLRSVFKDTWSWEAVLEVFEKFYKAWYSKAPNLENAMSAFFTYSRTAEFLALEMGLDEETISNCLKIEYRANPRDKGLREKVPPCLWIGCGCELREEEFSAEGLNIGRGLACDFYLTQLFPHVVGEIKVAVPREHNTYQGFRGDLKKCEL